ncbi:Rha family transcriptional regulator, partial [Acinetobacter baumannii]|nr:Rha family transcriptional regulator [Acinetobacter baumannii]
MNIINLDQLISMTSKEIAELTGKRHDNVIRDVRKMLDEIYPDGGLLS